jgi:hypothetical protein
MQSQEIALGERHQVTDVYESTLIQVRVVKPSTAVAEHWLCQRDDGSELLLPRVAFICRVSRTG